MDTTAGCWPSSKTPLTANRCCELTSRGAGGDARSKGEPMNDGQLSAFVVVADTGSITAAAPRLFVSQQVLTKRLRSLEAELGYPLFVRSHEGVRLTDAGREFYEDAVQLLAIRERALTRKLVPTPPRNTLHISCRSDASTMVLGHVCERCAKLHPKVEQVIVPLNNRGAARGHRVGTCRRYRVAPKQLGGQLRALVQISGGITPRMRGTPSTSPRPG